MKRAPQRLRLWRRDRDFTEAQAGAYFNTTRMTWHRWEAGAMVPKPEFMCALFREGVAEPNDFYDLPAAAPLKAVA